MLYVNYDCDLYNLITRHLDEATFDHMMTALFKLSEESMSLAYTNRVPLSFSSLSSLSLSLLTLSLSLSLSLSPYLSLSLSPLASTFINMAYLQLEMI